MRDSALKLFLLADPLRNKNVVGEELMRDSALKPAFERHSFIKERRRRRAHARQRFETTRTTAAKIMSSMSRRRAHARQRFET